MSRMNVSQVLGRWGAVGGLLAAGLFWTGCHTQPKEPEFSELPGMPAAPSAAAPAAIVAGSPAAGPAATVAGSPVAAPTMGAHQEWLLRAGDPLTIMFLDAPIIIPPFDDRIREDGTIALILNETFIATNKTRSQLEREIHDRYVPAKYRQLTVVVKPQEMTRFYYVGGEVKQPGRQVYISPITLTRAIQTAGDFTDFAKKTKVRLTRTDGRTMVINWKKVLKDPALDPEIYPGDKIHVPRRIF